jgi:hypothetical protein
MNNRIQPSLRDGNHLASPPGVETPGYHWGVPPGRCATGMLAAYRLTGSLQSFDGSTILPTS